MSQILSGLPANSQTAELPPGFIRGVPTYIEFRGYLAAVNLVWRSPLVDLKLINSADQGEILALITNFR